MPTTHADWQRMPEGREKYQAYLCGREWSVLKEAVLTRSGGVCERCFANEMDHVHHLTYERKYKERLDDLQAICKPCHDFVHAKSEYDPARNRPVFVCGKRVRSFYLAGKITGTRWRDEIVHEWSFENSKSGLWRQAVGDNVSRWRRVQSVSGSAHGVFLDYVGPWWRWTGGGGHSDAGDTHSPHLWCATDNHGMPWGCSDDEKESAMSQVALLVDDAVSEADLIFAWVDSNDCLGTMLELGMARALRKPVVVASPANFDTRETWLARQFADFLISADSAGEAWKHFWEHLVESKPKAPIITSKRMKK